MRSAIPILEILFEAIPHRDLPDDSGDLGNGELDAAAHRIDALRSHVHAVSQMPGNFFGLCAATTTRTRRAAPPFASGQSDDGVIPLPENAARAGGIFESVDRQQTLHEHF